MRVVPTIMGDVTISGNSFKCGDLRLRSLVQQVVDSDEGAYTNSEAYPDVEFALFDVIRKGVPQFMLVPPVDTPTQR